MALGVASVASVLVPTSVVVQVVDSVANTVALRAAPLEVHGYMRCLEVWVTWFLLGHALGVE